MPATTDLHINLNAIAHNWLLMQAKLKRGIDCGAVVKADAYGLGVTQVVRTLVKVGCRSFYVANLHEALPLREQLNTLSDEFGLSPNECQIIAFSGCARGEELIFVEHRIVPTLISGEMFCRWLNALKSAGLRAGSVKSVLKLDSGMGRLGVERSTFDELVSQPEALAFAGVSVLMSHLACADEPQHQKNAHQLAYFSNCFKRLKNVLPQVSANLANSAGILLGEPFHFDAVRPGIALYGGNPQPSRENDLKPTVELSLRVLQIKTISAGESVGYGAIHTFASNARVAIVAGGYADGLQRALSNRGECWVAGEGSGGWRAPIVGRISMDSTIIDISSLPEGALEVGDRVEFIGRNITLDAVAARAGTISYELLTTLGQRYSRCYVGG